MDRMLDTFFEKLYLENYPDLYKFAYRLTFERNMAEEIVQDAFVEAYKKIDHIYTHENPTGWLYVAVKNISKTYMREYMTFQKIIPLEECKLVTSDDRGKESFLEDYVSHEEYKFLLQFYRDKMSLAEIAEKHGISLSASKMRLKRTRDKLKAALKNRKY